MSLVVRWACSLIGSFTDAFQRLIRAVAVLIVGYLMYLACSHGIESGTLDYDHTAAGWKNKKREPCLSKRPLSEESGDGCLRVIGLINIH